MFYDSVRFIQIFEQNLSRSKGTVFTKNLIFYEGVRLIVFVVAVQRDRIHKSH
jgi:hypothetical protein